MLKFITVSSLTELNIFLNHLLEIRYTKPRSWFDVYFDDPLKVSLKA